MAENDPIQLVALLAREPGLMTLEAIARRGSGVRLRAVFTHRREPKSVDPQRGERPEYARYVRAATELGVSLYVVDSPGEVERMEGLADCRPFDVLLSVSWWYRVAADVLAWARMGAINVHRGWLPEYAGLKPVERALRAGEPTVSLTAHRMIEEIDAGEVLAEYVHPVGPPQGPTLIDDVERVKRELWPFYPRVAWEAIAQLTAPMSTRA